MKHFGLALTTLLFAACTADNYDTGDGKYSYLRADFVEAHTVASGKIDYAITDDGDSVSLNPVVSASWATSAIPSIALCCPQCRVAGTDKNRRHPVFIVNFPEASVCLNKINANTDIYHHPYHNVNYTIQTKSSNPK